MLEARGLEPPPVGRALEEVVRVLPLVVHRRRTRSLHLPPHCTHLSLSLRNKTQEKSPQLQQPPPNPLPPATGIAAPARRRPASPDRKELTKPSPSRESAGFREREREREGEGARERERYRELNAVKDLFHMEGAVLLVVALSPFAFTGSNEAATIGVNSERK